MLQDYIRGAMQRAHYEILSDDGSYYGEIPGFDGVLANAPMLEECREQLQEVLEDWILVGISERHDMPIVDGIEARVAESV